MRWLLLLLLVAAVACDQPVGHTPVARISATPRVIPEHDSFNTAVVLSGAASADPVDDPDGGIALAYRWEISGDEVHLTSGTLYDQTLTVSFLGDRPATIRLTVTDRDGQSSSDRLQMQLTLTP